ncbi:hypothetical protein MSG28_012652 [Choristoneura fumiferana]|uniref:Uncharacterized protein n=1 Tax=Choristoneura fumiferana TaxID=7141 RepID=A0ACC0JHD8_CHOFU|nr:hypothetical protein MSG28_012652 [Choristoneura fumiferana]
MLLFVCIFACASLVAGAGQTIPQDKGNVNTINLHNAFSEAIGNFSVELLYHTTKSQNNNLIVSPITVWTVLAVTTEGALKNTRVQLTNALRITKNRTITRAEFQNVAQWLVTNSSTVQLARYNGLFVDKSVELEKSFGNVSKDYYDTSLVPVDFKNGVATANYINQLISSFTRGRIPKLVDSDSFGETRMIITSALYFKGQWTSPFNASSTTRRAFQDSNGVKIGEVNMMYNRFTYPFANIKEIKARVIELPYGNENRLSMLIMLPNPGVTLDEMFLSLKTVPLDTVFAEMRLSQEEFGEDDVDCYIPRFKIESNLDLTETIRDGFHVYDLFDQTKSNLGRLAREPLYVTKVIHKAEIEVSEEGTTASAVTGAVFANRIGVVRFEANRPFSYLIVEKVTNTIVFGGIYQKPILY